MKKIITLSILGFAVLGMRPGFAEDSAVYEIYDQAFPVQESGTISTVEGMVLQTEVAGLMFGVMQEIDLRSKAKAELDDFLMKESRRLALEDLAKQNPELMELITESERAEFALKQNQRGLKEARVAVKHALKMLETADASEHFYWDTEHWNWLQQQTKLEADLPNLKWLARDAALRAHPAEEVVYQMRTKIIAAFKQGTSADYQTYLSRIRWARGLRILNVYLGAEIVTKLLIKARQRDPGFAPILGFSVEALLHPFREE